MQVAHRRHGGRDGNEDNRRPQNDLDGGAVDETVPFAIDGADYETDPSTKNTGACRWQRGENISVVGKNRSIAVSGRGRISASIADQYEAAMRSPDIGVNTADRTNPHPATQRAGKRAQLI